MWFYRHICAWFSPTNRYFHLLIETLQGWSELSSTEGSLYVKSQSYIPVCPIGPLIAHSSTWIVKYPEKYHCLRVWESMPKDMTSSHPYEHVVCSFSYWSFYWKLKTLHSFSASNLQANELIYSMSSTVVQDSDLSWTFTVSVNGTSSSIKHFLYYINSTKSIIVLKLYILRILMKVEFYITI